jgi:predicted transcriptional regulator
MPASRSNRVNVLLDDEHAARLHRLAERTYVNAGTLARSLLSTALDQAEPDPESVTALLDAIPGAHEAALAGVADLRAGRVVQLEDV